MSTASASRLEIQAAFGFQLAEALTAPVPGELAVGGSQHILFFYRPQADAQSLGLLPGGKPGGDEFFFHTFFSFNQYLMNQS